MLNRSLAAACEAGAGAEAAGAGRDDGVERDGRVAGAGAAANVCAGAAACGVEPENTRCPVAVVTLPVARLPARDGLLLPVRAGAVVRRSAAAGAWLRATLGVLNFGAGRACTGAAAAGAGCGDAAGAGAAGAGAGATTLKDAGAKPPVGRVAVTV